MEKFNLERALAGEPVCTRDGKDVTQLARFDIKQGKQCLIGVLDYELERWTIEGNYFLNKTEAQADLFMKPKENVIWVNVYKNSFNALLIGVAHETEEEAKKQKTPDNFDAIYIKTIRITDKLDTI